MAIETSASRLTSRAPHSARHPPVDEALPPGPRLPALAQSALFASRPYGFFDDCARRYGDPFTVRLVENVPMVVFSHPAAIKEIYTGDPEQMLAGLAVYPMLGPILGGHSVMILDGARHLRERRLILPQLHGERMHLYARTMRDMAEAAALRWPIGRTFPIHREMQAITLEVILRTVFGFHEGPKLERLRSCLLRGLKLIDGKAAALLAVPAFRVDIGPWSPWGRLLRDKADVRTILFEEIAERRARGTAGRTDILSMLLEARDEQGQPMTSDELYDEMFTLLIAGHETTATTLSWIFYRLLQHPDVVLRIREEIATVTGGAPVEAAHLPKLSYLEAAIHEAMRLHPVSLFNLRRLVAPTTIGGWNLPSGVNATPCIYLAQRRADVWEEPERYRPDRFLGIRANPYQFFPFGGGVRRCVGAAFASYEMKVVLAHLLPKVELRLAPRYRATPVMRAVTVAPSQGVPVVLDHRL